MPISVRGDDYRASLRRLDKGEAVGALYDSIGLESLVAFSNHKPASLTADVPVGITPQRQLGRTVVATAFTENRNVSVIVAQQRDRRSLIAAPYQRLPGNLNTSQSLHNQHPLLSRCQLR